MSHIDMNLTRNESEGNGRDSRRNAKCGFTGYIWLANELAELVYVQVLR